MNSSSSHNFALQEEASLWAARLEGSTLSTADRAALSAWLAENPDNRALLSDFCQLSADLEKLLPSLVADGAVPSPKSTSRRAPWYANWMAGSAVAAAAAIVVVAWLRLAGPSVETISTASKEHHLFVLADGTRVELNAHTSLQIENGRGERRVTLTRGEVFFNVTKNPDRPFIVNTPAGRVRVTGTSFDVRTNAATELDVTVTEGSVQVDPSIAGAVKLAAPIMLHAGDTLCARMKGATRNSLSESALDGALAWRQGQVVFQEGMPLSDALAYFARYHGCRIEATPEAAGLPVGGRYGLDDLDGFLEGIESTLGVRVVRESNGAVRVGMRREG